MCRYLTIVAPEINYGPVVRGEIHLRGSFATKQRLSVYQQIYTDFHKESENQSISRPCDKVVMRRVVPEPITLLILLRILLHYLSESSRFFGLAKELCAYLLKMKFISKLLLTSGNQLIKKL